VNVGLTPDVFRALLDRLMPTRYYVVSDQVEPGKVLRIGPLDIWPEVWVFYYLDFAEVAAELSTTCRLVDFCTWRPTAADLLRKEIWYDRPPHP
jgi:hypothetical protein